jgi:hypothetical protein
MSCTHEDPLEAEQAKHPYWSIVASLRYLVNTHLDLVFVVVYMSHFLEEPREDHLTAVKKILRYVVGTCNWRLLFDQKKGNHALLTGFSDGRKMISSTFVATEEHSSNEQSLPVATMKSEPMFEYQAVRLWNECHWEPSCASLEWTSAPLDH